MIRKESVPLRGGSGISAAAIFTDLEPMLQSRILVIRGGAIGDFILTLPVLAALRAQFSTARLEVLGYPRIARLALLGGLVDDVRSIEARALAGFFARNGDLDLALSDYFASCHLVISYLFDPDLIFQTNVRLCSPAQFIAGPHRPEDKLGIPASEVLLKPLERLAIYGADPVPRLQHFAQARQPQEALPPIRNPQSAFRNPEFSIRNPHSALRNPESSIRTPQSAFRNQEFCLAVHPGSGSERKNWPEARWAELFHRLRGSSALRLLLVGGEAEGDRLDRLAGMWPEDRLEVARDLPLPDLAHRLAGCDGFVGHDSGITHLAAAVGLPGVVLWGDTAESVWRPPSPRMRIVRHPAGLAALEVARVLAELEALSQ